MPHAVRTATAPARYPADEPVSVWTRYGLSAVMERVEDEGVDDEALAWLVRFARAGRADDCLRLARWTECPPVVLGDLLRHSDVGVVVAALHHPGVPLTPRRLRSLARSSQPRVRALVAGHPGVPKAVLRELLTDPVEAVAAVAAGNPSCPVRDLLGVPLVWVPVDRVAAVVATAGDAAVRAHADRLESVLGLLESNDSVTLGEALTVAGVVLT